MLEAIADAVPDRRCVVTYAEVAQVRRTAVSKVDDAASRELALELLG